MFALHTIEELEHHLQKHGDLECVVLQGINFQGPGLDNQSLERGLAVSWAGATVLGGSVPPQLQRHMVDTGALLFPKPPSLPFLPYRPYLYTIDELMDGFVPGDNTSLTQTTDYKIYEFAQQLRAPGTTPAAHPSVLGALLQRLHDHAIDDALADFLVAHDRVVAVMGGHALQRGEKAYLDAAELGRQLTRSGYLVTSGGGPGAMEAANLGAWLAPQADDALAEAIAMLTPESDYRTAAYLDLGFAVREQFADGADSLAVPTWFYGHEPTNQFATHVAKYFSNSIREDGLLALASHGVVFTPGSAGTVQEVFQDATQNHYGTFALTSPMVFLGTEFWTHTLPVVPLLTKLAGDRQYAELIGIVDTPAEALAFLASHPPVPSNG